LVGAMRELFSTDFRFVMVVDDTTLSIEPGEIIGFIEPKGAGKSTTIKILTGVLQPNSNRLRLNDTSPLPASAFPLIGIGFIPADIF
jgi:ABC-type uncharacterized transport system ATPase subunit